MRCVMKSAVVRTLPTKRRAKFLIAAFPAAQDEFGAPLLDTCGEVLTYTVPLLGKPYPVVHSLTTNDGRSTVSSVQTVENRYAGQKYDVIRRERLGVRVHESENLATRMVARTFFHQYDSLSAPFALKGATELQENLQQLHR